MTSKARVEIIEISSAQAGQRIDNFLIKHLKGVPKTRLYRALRGGEVRVNGARKKAPYQLCTGDKLRIPPLRTAATAKIAKTAIPKSLLDNIPIVFEDDELLVVDKPAGLAAHGGSGVDYGLIEALRVLRDPPFLELAHRLDRETSGCLVLAKSRTALLAMQAQFGDARSVEKSYRALLKKSWADDGAGELAVDAALTRHARGGRELEARSIFRVVENFANENCHDCALAEIRLLTGRMHQARRHAAVIDRPIAGDRLYGDAAFNRRMKIHGLRRLFLHARWLRFMHPLGGTIEVEAPLPRELQAVLNALRHDDAGDAGNVLK